MAPPLYADLGKPARNVFSRGYNFGLIKVNTTTRSDNIEFKTDCSQNISSGKLYGGVDLKYKIPSQGMTLAERWNTDNTLGTEVVIEDKLLKGLKVAAELAYAPYIGQENKKRSGKLKAEFKHNSVTVNGDVYKDSTGGPILNGAIVFGYQNWFLGWHTEFDPAKSKMTHSNFGLAFDKGDFGLHAQVNNATEFGGNLYHRVNKELELAANMNWTIGEQGTRFGFAAKYDVDRDTEVRAKINNSSQLGIGFTHSLKPGLKITVSTLLNLPNFNEGGHRFGFGVEYAPSDARKEQQQK